MEEGLEMLEGKYATFPVNGSWQPVGLAGQYEGRTAEYMVTARSEWAVKTVWSIKEIGGEGAVNWQHGPWNEAAAKRFARSMMNGNRSHAVRVAPYYWAPIWGKIAAEAVHALGEEPKVFGSVKA